MNSFYAVLNVLITLLLLVGCNDNNTNSNSPAKIVNITQDTVLSESSRNVQYVISKDGVTFDLGTKTLYVDGDYQAVLVRASNVTVTNGAIQGTGFETGVLIPSCIRPSDVQPLIDQGESYEPNIYNRCNKSLSVHGVHFENLRTGVYVSDYVTDTIIHNNIFKNMDRMGIYLSPSVTRTTISHNQFIDNGYRNVEGKGRPRGSISVDGAYANTITDNYFNSQPKWVRKALAPDYRVPEIEFYRNCGETTFGDIALPRIRGADNNTLTNNTFENVGLVAWFKYRDHDQLGSCVGNYPDQSNGNKLTGSTLINIEEFVYDQGENNIW